MSFAFEGFRILGCCSCVSFARDSVGGNSFLVMRDFARVHFYDFLVCKIRVLHELRTSSRGPAHGITTLANEASDVMGSSWRRPTVYLQRRLKLLTSCLFGMVIGIR